MALQQVHIRVPSELLQAVDERAARYDMSRNDWITRVLQQAVQAPEQVVTVEERF